MVAMRKVAFPALLTVLTGCGAAIAWSQSALLANSEKMSASPKDIDNMNRIFPITTNRLAPMIDVSKMKKRGILDGVEVYAKPTEGESVFRTGKLIINRPPMVVAELFGRWDQFKVFDAKNTSDSKEVSRFSRARSMAWFQSAPKWMISPRDFVVMSDRCERDDGSIIFVQYSNPKALSEIPSVVRGDIWTIMLIQPQPLGHRKSNTSLCTYVVEIQPHGWLPTRAIDMAADDIPTILSGLKAALEKPPQAK